MKLFVTPSFDRPDEADGGIRRVVEAQKKYLPKFGIDIVPTEEEADVVAIHAGSQVDTDKPIVAHCHGLYWNEYEWANWAEQLNGRVIKVMHVANQITAPSLWVANAIERAMWRKVHPLYHGIVPSDWPLLDKHENYVLWNKTRLDPVCDVKPVNELAFAMPQQGFVSTYGGENQPPNLVVTGALPYDQAKLLVQKAGIYLCTTRETFGVGTIEAMASGVPIVGWAWGGQNEFVEHKVDGYLVQPGDIDGLRVGIEYCLDPSNRQRMSTAARDKILRDYTWEAAMARYAPIYEAAYASGHPVGPKVSVIIPNYKLEKWLPQAINSVLAQDHTSFEIIVVNDCSPTWDDAVIPNDPRVKVVTTPSNQYLAGALNYGIEQSSGQYIVPLDADNMLHPGTLATLSSQLDKYRALDIAYGKVLFINPDGTPDRTIEGDGVSTWPPENFSFTAQLQHKNQIPSTSMYRRWVWERSGGYRKRCRTAEDADFWCRATSIGAIPARVTDAITLVYRQLPDSMSRVNKDWPWHEWYPWSKDRNLTPFAAPRDDVDVPSVQSYDPIVISVVIPVGPGHNEVVVDAVDSIIAQSYQKWSIIVVNDSGNELAKLPSFVKVISTPVSGSGPAVTRNLGISGCNSPYFLPLDADDILAPTALEDMLQVARINGGYVYSDWMIHESGDIHTAPEFDAEELKQALFHAVTCLYPTKAWQEVNGFDEKLVGWEDWDFALAICAKGYCGTRLPKPLLQYRMQSGTIREGLLKDRERNINNMKAKWPEGTLMACGSCGQGGNGTVQDQYLGTVASMAARDMVNPGDTSDLIQVEFIKTGSGMRTYRGQVTGREYYFSSDPGDNVKYVHKADAPSLVQHDREFKIYTGELVSQVPVDEAEAVAW